MTNQIRIDDLAAPVLNDIQRMGLEYGESKRTELTVDAVCEAAIARTGLDDFGPDDFRERLGLQFAEMDADDERTGLGRLLMFGDCTRYAANRLRIRELLGRHPEILDIPIERPVIVIGLPRSGTTNLVNLLAADSRFRSMPLWESYEPVPDPDEPAEVDGVDPRWTRCQQAWEAMQAGAPFVAAMHPMEPDHVHEEIELMAPDFSSYNLEWVARAPQWRDHYLAHDQTPHYAYLKQVLQILQWYRPRERWVLKSPQHLEQIGPLLTTFPDATIVVTHRDPVAVVQSTATMVCYGARTAYRTPRSDWYIEYWTDRIGRLLDASLR
ncbi:MAG: sulfotransferase family protein, partial [Acidimicrobiales bacterium]